MNVCQGLKIAKTDVVSLQKKCPSSVRTKEGHF